MYIKNLKDQNNRYLFFIYEKWKLSLKSIIKNKQIKLNYRFYAYQILLTLENNSSITKIQNRCIITGRARSVSKHFKLSRIMIRNYFVLGQIMGLKKSSW